MWPALIQSLIGPVIGPLLDRIPNANERARAKEDAEAQLLAAFNQASLAQTRINEIEAGHRSIFVAGWRPFIGWVCGAGIMWSFLVQPIAAWAVAMWGSPGATLPVISTDGLYQLVLAMLGMGGLRTFEKLKGVARNADPGKG